MGIRLIFCHAQVWIGGCQDVAETAQTSSAFGRNRADSGGGEWGLAR